MPAEAAHQEDNRLNQPESLHQEIRSVYDRLNAYNEDNDLY